MDTIRVKQEIIEQKLNNNHGDSEIPVIDLNSSDDDDSSTSGTDVRNSKRSRVLNEFGGEVERNGDKRKKSAGDGVVLPDGFLDPLPPKNAPVPVVTQGCKQFWKAGDFEQDSGTNWDTSSGGMDHVRVHPRFLHSNATSHKWVLGAFAELLDNSLDEVCNGATYVNIDMLINKKDRNKMLVIEDNGGGMDPDKMRQCMSLGCSLKSKVTDAIGQYGNGFKTSTMRLGADVIVFSRCSAKDGKRSTQSIGLLSYTFLRSTGKEDIVVPMLDYERNSQKWKKIIRSSPGDWERNMEAVVQWSPFSSEADLLKQFDRIKDQGTHIIIYNLWEDDQGQLELDFDTDEDDIQIRGVNRDEKNIQMANNFPNSRHFLTYRHSLRSYASILYLRVPPGFRMILRGKNIQHHNIVNDMMMTTDVTYVPQPGADGVSKDSNIVAVVTMGFIKDAKSHIDVQGYNVYHKNRLIKPFWRLWNASGSDGHGVIGVLEANFVEPAHDKQGFERTTILSRLETSLIQMQKTYWRTYCHKIGYDPGVNKNSLERESSPDFSPETSEKKKPASTTPNNSSLNKHQKVGSVNGFGGSGNTSHHEYGEGPSSLKSTPLSENIRKDDSQTTTNMRHTNGSSDNGLTDCSPSGKNMQNITGSQSKKMVSSSRKRQATQDPPSPSSSDSYGGVASPNLLHPWLQFSPRSAAFKKLNKLKTKGFECSRTISWKTLEDVGECQRARQMINPQWDRFFAIREGQFLELCLEFFSTYEFQSNVNDLSYEYALTFRLGGQERHCSVAQFGVLMGLHTEEETLQPIFLHALRSYPEGVTKESFWPKIAKGHYEGNNKSKATLMRDPLHRYLHRVIAHSIAGRRVTSGGVTKKDLFFMYCLIQGRSCNLAYMLADYFTVCTGMKKSGHICGGTYVTRLARAYGGILTSENLNLLTGPVLCVEFVDSDHVERMNMIRQFQGIGWRFVHHGHMWVPPPQGDSDDENHEFDVDQDQDPQDPQHQADPLHQGQADPRPRQQRGCDNAPPQSVEDMLQSISLQQTHFQQQQQNLFSQIEQNHQQYTSNFQQIISNIEMVNSHLRHHDEWFQWIYEQHKMMGGDVRPPPRWQWPPQQQDP